MRLNFAKAFVAASSACLLAACSTTGPLTSSDPKRGCAAIAKEAIASSDIRLPTGGATIDSANLMAPAALSVAERGPTPAGRITPATPEYCKVLGRIAPVDPTAPPILFQVNLPTKWNGRSVQYGGGGFNGVLITGLGLVPAALFDKPAPLAQGFVTVGTDSGHQNQPGQPPQLFALNNESLANFAHASYPKVRDVSVALMKRAYGRGPDKLYFVGSSEGGREGLTMAQRYPESFDGIFSRVPVIHWTGLQHAGLRDGLATMGDGWIRPPHVKLVHDAVIGACDALDGLADGLVSDPVGCRKKFDVTALRCTGAAADNCLSEPQLRAVQTLHSPYRFDFDLANGLREYPGRGPSGENIPAPGGPTGGWIPWWLGATSPSLPPEQKNSIGWYYGAGAIQYFYARDPQADLRSYKPADHSARVREVSALMDSTNPDLSAFASRGGKLVMLEYMADYAQSPYAGIGYFESVIRTMGPTYVGRFARLFIGPNIDHVGTGGPANVDALSMLVEWVERATPPASPQIVEQSGQPPFAIVRSRPLCTWPLVPRYVGGDPNAAASFACRP